MTQKTHRIQLFALLTAVLLGMMATFGGVGVGLGSGERTGNTSQSLSMAGNDGDSLTADINCTQADIPAGTPVTCQAVMTNGTAESFDWHLDNNRTLTGSKVTAEYKQPGNRIMKLTVTGVNGTTTTTTAAISVGPAETPPVAEIECSNTTLRVNESLSCSAEDSMDEREITDYEWQLDGNNGIDATGAMATHRYTEPGEYTVTLTVTDTNETTDVERMKVMVKPDRPPTAQLNCERVTLRVDDEFSCTASDSTDDSEIVEYDWTFGDGTAYTGTQVVHAYDSPGNRTVTLSVTDDRGATDTAQTTVTVIPNSPPTINISCAPESPAAGQTIHCITHNTEDPDGSIKTIHWMFNDGSGKTTGQNTSHSYMRSGNYTIQAVAGDNDGAETTTTTTVTVKSNRPPAAMIQTDNSPAVVGKLSTFRAANLTDPDGQVRQVKWSIDNKQAFGQVVTHRFDSPGDYDVTLRITDNNGREQTLRRTVTVLKRPTVTVKRQPTQPRVDQDIVLTAEGAPNGSQIEWDIDGDGKIEHQNKTIVTQFETAGRYSVLATVTTPAGVTVKRSKEVVVRQGAAFQLNRERQAATVKESVTLRLQISNRVNNQPIKAKLELDLPPGLSVESVGGRGLNGPASTQFISVSGGQEATLRVTVSADKPGSYQLGGTVVHYYAGQDLRGETAVESKQIEVIPRQTPTPTEAPASTETPTPSDDERPAVDPVVGAGFLTLLSGFLLRMLS